MLADTAKLAVELNLTGNIKSQIAGVQRSLLGLNRQSGQIGQGFKTMGAGIGVAFRNIAILGATAAGGLAAGFIQMAREGAAAAKVQTIYERTIANSGKVSTQYVAILDAQQKSLMNLAGVDDELIQTEQARLIQMGLTGKQVAALTPLILDMSKATGRDLLTTTLAVGKAVNGNVGGLQRYGVNIDKTAAKTDAFGAVQDALTKKFGGTTQALSGSLDARLGALRENLANIREEAGMKLLPAMTRIIDVVGTQLVPAFGKFIDRILPSVISGLDTFASMLENGGAERGIKAITDALGPMVDMLKIAAEPVKMIVKAFLSLPSQVQGILIGGFAINKLSGGLIGQGAGQVVKGALGGLLGGIVQRGGTPANPLFVSDVTGGLGGLGGKLPGIGLGAGAGVAGLTSVLAIAAIPAALAVWAGLSGPKSEFNAQGVQTAGMALRPEGLLGIDVTKMPRGGPKGQSPQNQAAIAAASAAIIANAIPASQRNPDRFDRAMFDAVRTGAEAGTKAGIIHSPLFAKARAIREAAGATLSLDVLRAGAGFGKFAGKVGAAGVETSAEAVALAQTNRLSSDPSQASLRSAAYNLSLIKADQKRLPADLASKLQPKIRSLEVAINRTTDAVNRATAAIRHIPGALGPILPGDTRSEGRSMGPGRANPSRASLPGDTRSEGRTMNANVSVSTRDINTGQKIKLRYGPTYTQAGAG